MENKSKKNILVIVENHKGHINETLYNENIIFKKNSKKFNYFFWGPGFDFKTNDIEKKIKDLKKKKIYIDLIYINIVQKFLLQKYDYSGLPKNFHIKKFEFFPINLHKVNIPKILLIIDFWQLNKYEWEMIFKKHNIDYVFSAHLGFELRADFEKNFITKNVNKKVKFFQYFRTLKENKKYLKKKEKKIYDLISLGSTWPRFYPNRLKYITLAKQLSEKNNFSFFTKEHPGYVYSKKALSGEKYFKILRHSKILITDSTYFGTHLIKTIECLKNKCIYATDVIYNPSYNFLKKNINYIEIQNSKNFNSKITKLLSNKKKINQIVNNGYLTYKKYYSNKAFVKRMEGYFLKILKNPNKIKNINPIYDNILYLLFKSLLKKILIILKKIYFKIFNIKKFAI